MSLQQDVLDSIGPEGVEKDKLRERVGNISQGELDVAVNALLRAQRLRLSFGRYEVIPSSRPLGSMPNNAAPPTAAEDLAANIGPAKRVCQDCKDEKELEKEFSQSNLGTGYLKTCKKCMARRSHAAKAKPEAPKATTSVKTTPLMPPPPKPARVCQSPFQRATAMRQAALNRISALEVDLENQRAIVARCDQFLEMHAEFSAVEG